MEQNPKTSKGAWVEIAIIFTQALVIGIAYLVNQFHGMSSAGCSPSCNYELFVRANDVFMWSAVGLLALTIAATVFLKNKPRLRLWPSVAALMITVLGEAVAYTVAGAALQP